MKRVLFAMLLFFMFGCTIPEQPYSNKWIVEDKDIYTNFYGHNMLRLSNVDDPTYMINISVGKYTFDNTNIGDTITLK